MSTMDRSGVKFGLNALFIIANFFLIACGSSFWVGGGQFINFLLVNKFFGGFLFS
jgi:hypothetical protein